MASTNEKSTKPHYEDGSACFEMGPHTLRISMSLHAENRSRLLKSLKEEEIPEGCVVLLQGGSDKTNYSSDMELIFRQESYFMWVFGVIEPGWYGAIHVDTGRTILFCPQLPEEYAVWMGHITTPEEFKKRYQVDEVRFVNEIKDVLQSFRPTSILTLCGINSDSGLQTLEAQFDGISEFKIDNSILHDVVAECRLLKTKAELEVLRYAAGIASKAHCEIMRKLKPNMKEYQLESIFRHYSYFYGGCRNLAYTAICASGSNGSILHYGHSGAPNDKTAKDGELFLIDAGCEYYCYASDITCTFPVNGKFNEDQKAIYNAVLAACNAVKNSAKPGKVWVDLHSLAYRTMLEHLKIAGIVKGDVEDMMKVNLGAIFQPHGLGHLLGLDVHDVGGYLKHCPSRPKEAGYKSLRMARKLEENMVLTVEPGCYFIDVLLDRALADPEQSKYLVEEKIAQFRGFGGVRIEDNIVITADGVEVLNTVPRSIEEIEALMSE